MYVPEDCVGENSELNAYIREGNSDQLVISPKSSQKEKISGNYAMPYQNVLLKSKDVSLELPYNLLTGQEKKIYIYMCVCVTPSLPGKYIHRVGRRG